MEGTNLESTEKFSMLEECVGLLEDASYSLDELEDDLISQVATQVKDMAKEITYNVLRQRNLGRAKRAGNVVNMLESVRSWFEEATNTNASDYEPDAGIDDLLVDVDTAIANIDSAISNMESLEFPGAFG